MFRLLFPIFLSLLFVSCDQQTEFDDKKVYYRPLRLSVSQQVPFHFVAKLSDGTYSYNGIGQKHFSYVANRLKRPLVVVVPNSNEMKKYGRIRASFNQAANGEVDISGMTTGVDFDDVPLVDFTLPVAMSNFKMLVPAAKEESRLFAFIRPFQPEVWLYLFVTLIGSIIAASGINWMYFWIDRQRHRGAVENESAVPFSSYLATYSIYTLNIMTGHGYSNPFTRNSLRIFGSLWLLLMTVMVYAYSGLLVGCLTVPTMTKPLETLDDVAASSEVVLQIDPKELAGMGKAVMDGKTGVWKALGDQLRRRPDGLYNNTDITEKLFGLDRQNYATPQLPNLLMWMVRRLYKKEKKCRFHLTKSIPFAVRFLYVLRKGDKDNEKIMRAIMELRENGLLDYYGNQVLFVAGSGGSEQCFTEKSPEAKDVPIRMVDLTSAFLILGIGLTLSILCFLLELIVSKYKLESMKMRKDPVKIIKKDSSGNVKDKN